jgi:hypothetical protein
MIEALAVLAIVAALVLLGLATFVMSVEALLLTGVGCVAAGFLLGLPAGTLYHVKLYQQLAKRGRVPRSFWLRPTSWHAQLEAAEWRAIAPWFVAGGTGFALIVLGCLIALLGLLRA